MQPQLYHLHTLSALHCGTGQSVGVVDLPIARARATQFPIVPGSSVRGVLREHFASTGNANENFLFGPRGAQSPAESHAGALAIDDAHLLALPVRALAGIVAYATCPFILKRYAKDLSRCGVSVPAIPKVADDRAAHATDSANVIDGLIVLEDLDVEASLDQDAQRWAKRIATSVHGPEGAATTDFERRFVVLSDTVFSFLAETATEVRTRIAIDQATGTVKQGQLWTEENLPAETLLWGVYAVSNSRARGSNASAAELAREIPRESLLQLGGKAGVGRGLTRFLTGS